MKPGLNVCALFVGGMKMNDIFLILIDLLGILFLLLLCVVLVLVIVGLLCWIIDFLRSFIKNWKEGGENGE